MNLSPNAINRVQQQQALVYFQQPNDQNVQGEVSQIFHFDGAAAVSWPEASTIDDQGLAELQPSNAIQQQDFAVACLQEVQVQEGQTQQIISNDRILNRHELSTNALAACAVTSTPSQQQMPLFSHIQAVDAGAQESSHQLQKDSNDTEKWQVLASVTIPATLSTPMQQSLVSKSVTPNLAIAATTSTSTSAEFQSSSALDALRMRMRVEACPCPNCDDQDENFLLNIEKVQVIASATNPATLSTPIQHSQISESVALNLAIAANSTISTSAVSESSSALYALCMRMRKEACPSPNCNDQDERNKKSKKKEYPCIVPGCTKVYGQITNLRVHYRCHTGYRPFVCSWTSCGKKFFRSDYLLKHQRRHTGEKKKFSVQNAFGDFIAKMIFQDILNPIIIKELDNCRHNRRDGG